jgi:predicted RNA-binding protein YlxR (DUF448 family)
MLRVVKTNDGAVIDDRQVLPGRGAYVHRDVTCLERAVSRGGLARSLRTKVSAHLLDVAGRSK